MAAPELSLYIGQKVIAITRGDEAWEWGIKLESGVEIRNKDPREIFRPMGLVKYRFQSMSMSGQDTTLHFMGPSAAKFSIGLKPTGYVIYDPAYGSEVFPQWPEELEDMGIHANEGLGHHREPAGSEWPTEELRLKIAREVRTSSEASDFIKDTEEQ